MRLFLIRHPRPDIANGICYGRSDVAVATAELARTAHELAARLPADLPLLSSPLRRCAMLAERLATSLQVAVRYDARLAEMDFGHWEMRAWQHIARAEIDAWASDLTDYQPGGGESVLQVASRVASFLDELSQAAPDGAIVVCHAGTIRLLLALIAVRSSTSQSDQSIAVNALKAAALAAARTPHQIAYGEILTLEW
ncbi:alpha-ribazole phosphatase family protein [Undibacterium arcticum]|uniref:Alpha-ribazole phosphatase family protein n=1 Tax=Undibacterium arcticum TaxID=1762892 RepID=A0ABV7F6C2_9BURK